METFHSHENHDTVLINHKYFKKFPTGINYYLYSLISILSSRYKNQNLFITRNFDPKYLYSNDYGYRTGINQTMTNHVKNIVKEGISILFVEQNVRLALSMADRGYVLESGRLVVDGKSEDLIDNEKVTKVFLGN